ncbi:hypothetical protein POTOM_046386 [Populus tomentosa]|uniref:Uncharacterized protein n=1 Tax=Populus tomentosa TaxID=118781 RepID=A0A8X7YI27_POPTO|nr:hypothetical protein POTOM_046386 [Populus tomentosa]
MQAIALSLHDSVNDATPKERKVDAQVQEDAGRRKRKKSFSSRVQMTEDDLILHFFQFDEAGKGAITMRDLRRVAIAHDFTWTDKELADMILCFDGDGDGKSFILHLFNTCFKVNYTSLSWLLIIISSKVLNTLVNELTLDDFRKIAGRCNMLQSSENQ